MKLLARFLSLLLHAFPTVVMVIILSFLLIQLAPGDLVDYISAETGAADEATTAALRESLGLNLSAGSQFLNYLLTLAHGSLGVSLRFGEPVLDLILKRLPATLLLVALAISLAIALGVTLGGLMAFSAGQFRDHALTFLSLLFYSLPSFWIGLMLIVLFSVKLGWLPTGGSRTLGSRLTGVGFMLDQAKYLVMPVISLALYYVAVYARLTRASVLDVREQDYVRTAIAKGLTGRQVAWRHVLRNALIPVTAMAGMHIGALLGGAVVIETIFSWPGMGRLTFEAIQSRDYMLLLGIMLISAIVVIIVNTAVELLHGLLDPRIEVRR